MADPLILRIMLQFKADLLAREVDQTAEMARRWLQLEQELEGQMTALAMEIDNMRLASQPVNRSRILGMVRYKALLGQAQDELAKYSNYANGIITDRQREWMQLGLENGIEGIRAYYVSAGRVVADFNILPVSAIENMVGLAGDGSPLYALLKASWPDALVGLTDQLIKATALGINPRDTARAMSKGFGVGLSRAMNIARTEQLRVYRTAGMEQYKASGVVKGWKRLSARDDRVCAACLLADDGTIHDLDEPFEGHPQDRCTQVPVVEDMPEVEWKNGQEWFSGLDESRQRSILGPGRFDAWQSGKVELSDLVDRRENDTWGASLVPTPVGKL